MIAERSQGRDAELARIGQCNRQAFVRFLAFRLNRILSRPNLTGTSRQTEKGKRPAIALIPAALQQYLSSDEGAPRAIQVDRQFIGDRTLVLCLPVVHLELDRFSDAHRAQTLKPAPLFSVARRFDADRKAVRYEPEGIEQRALAGTVLSDHDRQWRERVRVGMPRQPAKRHVSQRTVVLNAEALDQRQFRPLWLSRTTWNQATRVAQVRDRRLRSSSDHAPARPLRCVRPRRDPDHASIR